MSDREDYIVTGLLGVVAGLFMSLLGFMGREVHQIAWGLFVPGYVYFALISIGASIVASFCLVFRYREAHERLYKYARLSSWFSLATIIPAWLLIILDLTRPSKFYLIYLSFNPEARIAWMAGFYGLFALFLIIELVFLIREETSEKVARMKAIEFTVALLVLVFELGLVGNLAQVFGSLTSVPFWYGVHMVTIFLSLALLMGASGVSLMLTPYMREAETREFSAKYYGKIMLVSSLAFAYFLIWTFLTAWYNRAAFDFARQLLAGRHSLAFWAGTVLLGIVLPIAFSSLAVRRASLLALRVGAVSALAGGLATLAALIILPQTMPPEVLGGYIAFSYSISMSEAVGLAGAFVLWPSLFLLGNQLLAVLPSDKPRKLFLFK